MEEEKSLNNTDQDILNIITEIKEKQIELEALKVKYFDIYNLAPIGYLVLNRDGFVLEANNTACLMLNLAVEDFVMHSLIRFIFPEDHAKYDSFTKKFFADGEHKAFEVRMLKNNGTKLWVRIRLSSVQSAKGKQLFLATLGDMSEVKKAEREMLQEKEEEFKIIFDNVSDGILLADISTRKFYQANNAVCKMLGYTSSEIRKLGVVDIHPEKDLPYVLSQFDSQAKGEFILAPDLPVKRKDGTVFYADVNAISIVIDKKPFLMGIFHDTTERKKIADALAESEKRFMDILYASDDAILLIDGETFVECNEATVRMLGYSSREEFLMSHPSSLSPPEQPDGRESFEKANEMIETALEKGFHRFMWIHKKANGDNFPVDVSLTPIIMHGKTVLHCLWRDISEARRIQDEKERMSAEVRDLYENAPCGYHSLDKDGIFVRINNTELSWLGYTRDELVGKMGFANICTPQSKEIFYSKFAAFKESGIIGDLELEVVRKDGSTMLMIINATAIRDSSGNFIMSRSTTLDMTEYKRIQKERAALEKQLYQAQRMDAIGTLSTEIAHDFNNILAAIIGFTDLFLNSYREDDENRETIEKVNAVGKKGLKIVKQILSFAKPKEMVFETLDIVSIINDTLLLLSSSMKRISKVSVCVVPKQIPTIKGDIIQIQQLLLNLFSNAMDAMEGKLGELSVTIDEADIDNDKAAKMKIPSDSYLELAVKDTGHGMNSEVKQKLFEPFFSTKNIKGTGLGLSIVQRIVQNHNGVIQVNSELGVGTTVIILFPIFKDRQMD